MRFFQYYYDFLTNKFFDYWLGVETCTQVYPYDMLVSSNNIIHATRYQGCHVRVFKKLIRELPPEYRNYNFIDFGHGKGRALILAAKYGMKKLIGIEFARDLYDTSNENWHSFESRFNTGADCDLIHGDVINFNLNTSKNIYFFFNPFRDKVMKQLLINISNSSPTLADDLFIFVNPRNHFLFDLFDMKLVHQIDSYDYNRVTRFYKITGPTICS